MINVFSLDGSENFSGFMANGQEKCSLGSKLREESLENISLLIGI